MWHTLLKVDFDYLICSTLCFHEFPPKYYVHYLCSLAKARKENPQLHVYVTEISFLYVSLITILIKIFSFME